MTITIVVEPKKNSDPSQKNLSPVTVTNINRSRDIRDLKTILTKIAPKIDEGFSFDYLGENNAKKSRKITQIKEGQFFSVEEDEKVVTYNFSDDGELTGKGGSFDENEKISNEELLKVLNSMRRAQANSEKLKAEEEAAKAKKQEADRVKSEQEAKAKKKAEDKAKEDEAKAARIKSEQEEQERKRVADKAREEKAEAEAKANQRSEKVKELKKTLEEIAKQVGNDQFLRYQERDGEASKKSRFVKDEEKFSLGNRNLKIYDFSDGDVKDKEDSPLTKKGLDSALTKMKDILERSKKFKAEEDKAKKEARIKSEQEAEAAEAAEAAKKAAKDENKAAKKIQTTFREKYGKQIGSKGTQTLDQGDQDLQNLEKEILKPLTDGQKIALVTSVTDSLFENSDGNEEKKSPGSENIKKLKDTLERIAPDVGEEYLFEMPQRGNIKIKNEGAGVFSFGEKDSLKYKISENEVESEAASIQDRLKNLLSGLSVKKSMEAIKEGDLSEEEKEHWVKIFENAEEQIKRIKGDLAEGDSEQNIADAIRDLLVCISPVISPDAYDPKIFDYFGGSGSTVDYKNYCEIERQEFVDRLEGFLNKNSVWEYAESAPSKKFEVLENAELENTINFLENLQTKSEEIDLQNPGEPSNIDANSHLADSQENGSDSENKDEEVNPIQRVNALKQRPQSPGQFTVEEVIEESGDSPTQSENLDVNKTISRPFLSSVTPIEKKLPEQVSKELKDVVLGKNIYEMRKVVVKEELKQLEEQASTPSAQEERKQTKEMLEDFLKNRINEIQRNDAQNYEGQLNPQKKLLNTNKVARVLTKINQALEFSESQASNSAEGSWHKKSREEKIKDLVNPDSKNNKNSLKFKLPKGLILTDGDNSVLAMLCLKDKDRKKVFGDDLNNPKFNPQKIDEEMIGQIVKTSCDLSQNLKEELKAYESAPKKYLPSKLSEESKGKTLSIVDENASPSTSIEGAKAIKLSLQKYQQEQR